MQVRLNDRGELKNYLAGHPFPPIRTRDGLLALQLGGYGAKKEVHHEWPLSSRINLGSYDSAAQCQAEIADNHASLCDT